jgi:hypothetical protein
MENSGLCGNEVRYHGIEAKLILMEQKGVVAVIGATGKTGALTIQKLLENGNYIIRAIVRDPQKAKQWSDKGKFANIYLKAIRSRSSSRRCY